MRSFILSLFAVLVFAAPAFAAPPSDNVPTIGGKGVVTEIGADGAPGAGLSFVGTVVYFEADDTAAYTGPTAAAELDAGDEACAVYGLTCALVWTITTGASPAITVDADGCTSDTTVADNAESFAICY